MKSLVCFFIVKGYNASKRAGDDKSDGESIPSETDLLIEIRDELRRRD